MEIVKEEEKNVALSEEQREESENGVEEQEDEDGLEDYGLQMIMKPEDQEQKGIIGDKQRNENVEGKEQILWYVTELKADSELFAMQQKEDESLTQWWKLSEGKGSEFVVINDLSYKSQKNFMEKYIN